MKPVSMEKRKGSQKSRASAAPSTKPVSSAGRLVWRLSSWQWGAAAILSAAAILRLVELTLKPLHHDEGVNGLFLTTLFRGGPYVYNPSNFHGPTLYYFAWITTTVNSFFYGKDGLSTFAIRLTTVLFGVGVVWLLLCLRRELGTFGVLSAALLATVSPGMVFFSRYFIHEILFIFFTLGVVIAVLRFRRTREPRYLMLAATSLALLGATKETWVITVLVWLIALPCTSVWLFLRRKKKAVNDDPAPQPLSFREASAGMGAAASDGRAWRPWQLYSLAALLFVSVWVLFYSSFFTNFPQGVVDSVRTFGYWFQTSHSAHEYGPTKYLEWIWREDAPTLILGAAGIAIAFSLARNRFAVFAAFWSLGILAAYSLVGYKTPWCALNILLPFTIIAGYGLGWLYRQVRGWVVPVIVIATGISLYQAIDLNFYHYDDDSRSYVYAHTERDFLTLVNEINSIAAGQPAGNDIGIVVMSPEHWPLPWYLRNYKNAGFYGKVVETSEPILIVHETQIAEVELKLGARYRVISSHELRPGNRLYLYLRRDLQP
jgi:uncharacterized protein (TIGR03663 family)